MTDNEWRSRSIWFVLRCCFASGWMSVRSTWAMYAPWHERAERDAKHGYCKAPWWAWPLWVTVGMPLFAFEQAYGCHLAFDREWPYWPLNCATRIHNAVGDFIERHVVNFSYLAPDSGAPNEIGLHYRADLLTLDRETYEYVNRPRAYVWTSSGSTSMSLPTQTFSISP